MPIVPPKIKPSNIKPTREEQPEQSEPLIVTPLEQEVPRAKPVKPKPKMVDACTQTDPSLVQQYLKSAESRLKPQQQPYITLSQGIN